MVNFMALEEKSGSYKMDKRLHTLDGGKMEKLGGLKNGEPEER